MRRNVSISRNRTNIERLLDWKEFPSKSVGRFSFQCLTVYNAMETIGVRQGMIIMHSDVMDTVFA